MINHQSLIKCSLYMRMIKKKRRNSNKKYEKKSIIYFWIVYIQAI
jgi:hypothetical protein